MCRSNSENQNLLDSHSKFNGNKPQPPPPPPPTKCNYPLRPHQEKFLDPHMGFKELS